MSDEVVVRTAGPSPVKVLWDFALSSIGAKVIMALTGVALWIFLVAHLAGNALVMTGTPDAINAYGVDLRAFLHGSFVWVARAGLLASFVLHVWSGLRLASLNRKARPKGYGKKRSVRTNIAALTMATSGILIFVFLIVHLLHFTFGAILPSSFALTDAQGRHDIFKMVWTSFKMPSVVAFYVVSQVLVLGHLYHGAVSVWQSLGLHHKVWSFGLRVVGQTIVALIIAGNLAIPLAILLTWPNP
jgi:succinate dehydrogenase / fumarate reductase, cytochrome b subunit